jgi:MSHA type pilus biogenesis protein MshL
MIRQLVAILAVALFMTGCVNPAVSTIQNTKAAPTYLPPPVVEKQEPPHKDPDAYRATDPGRTYSLTLKNADINDVLMLLSKESHVPIVAERGLRGSVKIEAQNKKLGEMLYAILKPLGYTATVENGIIMVGRPQLSTRTFRVNYIKDKRNSTSNMNVSGFSGSGTGSGSSGGSSGGSGGGSGSVSISTEGKSDYWGAIESSLEMMIFGTSGQGKRDGGGYSRGEVEKKIDTKTTSTVAAKPVGGQNTPSALPAEIHDPLISSTQLSENKLKQLLVNELAGIIQITDYPENLDKIAAFLADVEVGTKRQVLIQAHIMEVTLRDKFSLGVNWNTVFSKGASYALTQGIPVTAALTDVAADIFKFQVKGKDFGVVLDALKDQGNINMLSSPKISALNNQKAVIKLTTKQVSWIQSKTTTAAGALQTDITYQPQIDEVGIFLDVTPQIADSGKITMQIHPSVSEVLSISSPNDDRLLGSKPVINVREIDTMVEATSGETIVIAGLISDKLSESKRSIPLLGDIPYLGALFSKSATERTKSELVIMLTPYVLNTKNIEEIRLDHEKRMRDMGGNFHLINNLGSMVTEQSSRDWIKRTNQTLPRQDEPEIKKQPAPQAPAAANKPQASTFEPPAAPSQAVHVTQPAKTAPLSEKQTVQPVTVPATQNPNVTAAAVTVKEKTQLKLARTSPTLETIQPSRTGIRLDISKLKERPTVLREYKAKKILVKLPGVQSGMGDVTVPINQFGFGSARVARHADGIWAVFQATGDELPTVVAEHDKSGLTLRVVPTAATAVKPAPKAAI